MAMCSIRRRAIPLFAAFLVVPIVLWWAIPIAGMVARSSVGIVARPSATRRHRLLRLVSRNLRQAVTATPSCGSRSLPSSPRAGPFAGPWVLLKPSVFPFAAIGITHRAWWISVASSMLLLFVIALPLTLDWIRALLNSSNPGGLLYSPPGRSAHDDLSLRPGWINPRPEAIHDDVRRGKSATPADGLERRGVGSKRRSRAASRAQTAQGRGERGDPDGPGVDGGGCHGRESTGLDRPPVPRTTRGPTTYDPGDAIAGEPEPPGGGRVARGPPAAAVPAAHGRRCLDGHLLVTFRVLSLAILVAVFVGCGPARRGSIRRHGRGRARAGHRR